VSENQLLGVYENKFIPSQHPNMGPGRIHQLKKRESKKSRANVPLKGQLREIFFLCFFFFFMNRPDSDLGIIPQNEISNSNNLAEI
jgi:hypothetical protein